MANRDLFAGGDYQRPRRDERPGGWLGRLLAQGLAALVLFAGVVYLYDQESALGEGVRYVVALATTEQQEAMAVNGLMDFWHELTAGDDGQTGNDNEPADDGQTANGEGQTDENNDNDNAADSSVLPTTTDYHPGEELLTATPLTDSGEPVLILPASGLMQSAFGDLDESGLPVSGLEIFCQQEQTIKAAAIGEVKEVIPGQSITLTHSGDMETVYAGDISAEVKEGDVLRQGEVIGRLTDGVLLFQVMLEGEPQDPLLYVLGPE